jgi:HAD superfamily hydrolase (TIGR01549 family)
LSQILRSVLFDFGNTLVMDPFKEALKMCQDDFEIVLRNGHYGISIDILIAAWTKHNKETHGCHYSHFFQETAILDRALQFLNIIQNREQLISTLLDIYRSKVLSIISNSRTIAATRKILKVISDKYSLGVVSNERKTYLNTMLYAAGISDCLTLVLSSEEVGEPKPSLMMFKQALEILQNQPQEVLYIGDEIDNDIIPARNVGMNAILYVPHQKYQFKTSWRKYCNNDYNIYRIHNFSELRTFLKQFG